MKWGARRGGFRRLSKNTNSEVNLRCNMKDCSICKYCDWSILIYKRGCADDYPKARRNGEDVVIVDENDCDMELCFAKAHVGLKEWLSEFNGGY